LFAKQDRWHLVSKLDEAAAGSAANAAMSVAAACRRAVVIGGREWLDASGKWSDAGKVRHRACDLRWPSSRRQPLDDGFGA